jgi:DNA-binding response OmpR family regulator
LESQKIVLLAKETENIRNLIKALNIRGFNCTFMSRNEEFADIESTDLSIIETGPDMSGPVLESLIKHLKDRHIPVFLLSDRDTILDIEEDSNFEDFLFKPYNADELAVRIKRVLHRKQSGSLPAEYLKSGDLIIDLPKCEVKIAGNAIDLTFTEYELLKYLINQKGRVLTREVLLNNI